MKKFWIDDLITTLQVEFANVAELKLVEVHKSREKYAEDYVVESAVLEDPLGRRFAIGHFWNPKDGHSFEVTFSWFDEDKGIGISLTRDTWYDSIGTDAAILWVWAGRIAHMMANKEVLRCVDEHIRKLVGGDSE
ncbi:hypothetical protein E3E35_08030 [Thermococcus sp. GR7]|uniref:hypothetical protein n=1 Tax=unclassified Thermococcus TaxID=2627626 RepID=UPI001431A2CF|nr:MULTISPECIES: hypothetical protein [unclassified Thermococcus]NJE47347.1 hypothetical protein [Thermococcus sp. GR7]NJE79458.1 hypothetical protein [Thermococcus sp. GR4]NJF23163.1 hypothetical protein [Thermococcus sp. GR5]